METKKLVIGAIKEIMEMKDTEINNTDKLRDDLGMDSLDLVEIAIEIEETLKIRISDDEWNDVSPIHGEPNSNTVEDLINLVDKYINK